MDMTGGLGGPARFPQSYLRLKEESSFSEEKEAKRLLFPVLCRDA
jgi:hypothetical protein